MRVLHLLSVALAIATVVAGVTLVGVLTHRLTDHGPASLVAGATMFVLPTVYTFPSAGIRPKYFAFLCGVGALILAIDDRPAMSGVAAAMGAGFWQLGGFIAFLVVFIGLQRGGTRAMGRTIAGGIVLTVVVVLPFVVGGLTVPLFVETVLAPLYTVERYTIGGRFFAFLLEVGYGTFLLPIGIYGWGRGIVTDPPRYWWVGVGGTLYLFQVFLEMQGAIELILLLVFLAIGVGLLVANIETPSRRTVLVVVVVSLAVLNATWAYGAATPLKDDFVATQEEVGVTDYETVADAPANVSSMETIYWEKEKPTSCHYRAGYKQRHFVTQTNTAIDKRTCGQWPFKDPPRTWILERVSPL